ncbi:recombinase family protein [Vibrio parahaemolyticus]|uniref:recombinase family protein n=1 Tax=Vibrio sp. ES.051 TaxID=1761909 RepID=UPI000BFA8E65|nr:recombinase family protein [Vibrio sp. ES.051]EGQ9159415.1 helix-turn-helix domain-containing protein [Vibrio parahaemolyticus]EGR1380230.1 recombinase family protein [Vibrio parahaemolyticus]EHK2880612.1 recombinase family protein [Vibrio parahaemolyticus]EJS4020875.1 recombinase family protein [Vibrio parahaemolyticus]ELA7135078.1 recombinase family protein [Vibrio parahaemolyticus]
MNHQKVGYIRVSSADQNTDRQLADLELDKIFTERMSGRSKTQRPILQQCLDYLREGDQLYVHAIDRLARNLLDLQQIINEVNDKGASVHFVTEGLEFSKKDDPFAELTLQMLGAFAEFERKLINTRQREGMAAAKAKGKHIGRPSISSQTESKIRQKALEGVGKAQIAKDCNVSRQTVYRVLQSQ